MNLDVSTLERYTSVPSPSSEGSPHPPPQPDLLLVAAGNSGETVALRVAALAAMDGIWLAVYGLNNDGLPPRPLTLRLPSGEQTTLHLSERLVLSGDNPRDQLRDYPVLERRYARLLRGIPVLETYPRAGYGGHGHPVISALDIDLHSAEVVAYLRRALRRLRGDDMESQTGSDWMRTVARFQHQSANSARRMRIALLGGGSGSMGNAGHHLLPALLRSLLGELSIGETELWGFVFGPQAFAGLTPFVRHNHRALLQALDHMTRNGQHRTFINDLDIAIQAPPYDRLFLLDDPNLPGTASAVTEAEQEAFFDRAALSIYVLLTRGTVWQTVASHTANDDGVEVDGRPRYLHTVRTVLADVDRERVRALLTARIKTTLLETVADRLAR